MKIPYFCCIGAELKRYQKDFDFMNQVYLYKVPTDDTIDEVLAEDYFKAISDTVLQDDIVYIYETTSQKIHVCRFDKENGHITVVKLVSGIPELEPDRILVSDQNGNIAASDMSLEYIKDTTSILHCTVPLSNTIDTTTVVMLDELDAFEHLDSRPSYKAAGAIVVDSLGSRGIIESVDQENQTAAIITIYTAVKSINGQTGEVILTGEDISADVSEQTDTVQGHLQTLHDNIKDIELFKFPNATIIGEPIIQNGQVSGFTAENYLQFPFILDLHDKPFVIDFCFTTGNDVTTQQNILDSEFGLALAIANGKGLMAISHNGTSWAGSIVGTLAIQPNTTYYARMSWNRMNYQTQLSTDGTTYTPDMNFGSTQSPYPRTMFIGGCSGSAIGHTPHPFSGTINMNYAYLTVDGNIIWQGMDDAGLATRMTTDVSNITEAGKERIKQIVGGADGETIKNQNTDSEITKTYDWVGTLQEAIDQNVRELHPDWIIKITDDVSGGSDTMYTKTEVDTGFVAKGHEVIAFQAPTAANNYTWYRKYADGWVEQGGIKEAGPTTINFPVTMANTDYWYIAKGNYNNTTGSYSSSHDCVMTKNTTNMVLSTGGVSVCWQVNGMAA